jgi:hypothetical protein
MDENSHHNFWVKKLGQATEKCANDETEKKTFHRYTFHL